MRVMQLFLFLATVSLATSAFARARRLAQAGGATATCDDKEILATNDGKGVDPKLADLKPQLSRPPFNAWNTFKLLRANSLRLTQEKLEETPLVPGGKLKLTLKEKTAAAGKSRLRVAVEIDYQQKSGVVSTTLTFDSERTLFPFAGMPHENGTYILALACR